MEEASLQIIEKQARTHHLQGKKWHFHLFSPDCMLNKKGQYAFVLEQAGQPTLVHYSSKMEMDLRNELLPLLHGDDVMESSDSSADYKPSSTVKEIVDRAKQLNTEGVAWHHHVLFPDCAFNKHGPKWVLMFEDKQHSKILESLTDKEPKQDLQQIEPLFK